MRVAEELAWLRVWIRKAILHPMTVLFIALPPSRVALAILSLPLFERLKEGWQVI